MSIENGDGYTIVNFGLGTICLSTVFINDVPGVVITFGCHKLKVGEPAECLTKDCLTKDNLDSIGAALAFHNIEGLENFIRSLDEVRELLEQQVAEGGE